jgi:hypothetical protein
MSGNVMGGMKPLSSPNLARLPPLQRTDRRCFLRAQRRDDSGDLARNCKKIYGRDLCREQGAKRETVAS